ncbi:MAG: DUF3857 domain-containing protein [Mucilaginibacter sp.]
MRNILFCFLLLSSLYAEAQDFPYGEITQKDIDLKKYEKDTSAHAVVLAEFGKCQILAQEQTTPLDFEYHVKIKILDSKALDKGNVEILFRVGDSYHFDKITDITGITYNLAENGRIEKTELDPQKIYTTNENKYWNKITFAMPNAKSGSIIEYKYKLESPYLINFKSWEFQSDIPKIYSEYEVHIPAYYRYNVLIRGPLKLSKNPSEVEKDCFDFHGFKCDCSKITYAINDVPAFIEEDYMTAKKNFLSAMYFELSEYADFGANGVSKKLSKEWKDVDYELKHDESFGNQIKRKDMLKDVIMPVIANKTTELDKAEAIYAYIQKNIKWNQFYSMSTDVGVKKALDKHTGTVADVNLALVSALNAGGINTDVVMLSTRDHGVVNKLYPVITEFDYVIARATIGNKTYLLDATDPLLGFGMLPVRCLNDQGRVMSLDKPSFWTDLNTGQKEKTTTLVEVTLQENGKLKGTITRYSSDYSAYLRRRAIKKFNTVDEYVEDLDEKMPKMKILKSEVTNIDSLDKPLAEKYEVEIDAFKDLNNTRFTFNPYLLDRVTTNPFKLTERNYPVDMGVPSENTFLLNMNLPEGYTIENAPQNATFVMPDKGGKFSIAYSGTGNSFNFSHITQFNKPIYDVNEYPALKELYNKIILSEKAEMVFKK